MWNKNTSWRQCSMISVEILQNYNPNLVRNLNEDITYLCAISHDGDIINDNMVLEPSVEFIGAKRIDSGSAAYTYGKSPSLLHLNCIFNGEPIVLELKASPKIGISKHNIVPAMQPDKSFFFDDRAKATLQNWLSLRYRRHSFPASFVTRAMPVWDYLKNEGSRNSMHTMGYWVDYDPKDDELPILLPYTFSLYIVYSARNHEAREAAEKQAKEICERFPKWKENVQEKAGEIELNECKAYAEDCFTLADLQNCIYFNLDQVDYLQESGKDNSEA